MEERKAKKNDAERNTCKQKEEKQKQTEKRGDLKLTNCKIMTM